MQEFPCPENKVNMSSYVLTSTENLTEVADFKGAIASQQEAGDSKSFTLLSASPMLLEQTSYYNVYVA